MKFVSRYVMRLVMGIEANNTYHIRSQYICEIYILYILQFLLQVVKYVLRQFYYVTDIKIEKQ